MSLFKKSDEGFLARLFKHKKVDELAQELADTYADEMQADTLTDQDEPTTSEDVTDEQVPMLEVSDTGEVDFDTQPENAEDESPPKDTEPTVINPEVKSIKQISINNKRV